MKDENLAVAEMGYGFDSPRTNRGGYARPPNRLREAFEEWLDNFPIDEYNKLGWEAAGMYNRFYRQTMDDLKRITYVSQLSSEEVVCLASEFVDHPNFAYSGLFISAIHSLMEETDIVFDLETDKPIKFLGCATPKSKRLILDTNCGILAGVNSECDIANYGYIDGIFGGPTGYCGTGNVINFGQTRIINSSSPTYAINMGSTQNMGNIWGSGININFGDVRNFTCGLGFCFNGGRATDWLRYDENLKPVRDDEPQGPKTDFFYNNQRFFYNPPDQMLDFFDMLKKSLDEFRERKPKEVFGLFDVVRNILGPHKDFEKRIEEMGK